MTSRKPTPRLDARDRSPLAWRGGWGLPLVLGLLVALAIGASWCHLAGPASDPARDEYIRVWAERIDSFNAGYPLEGYGATFAAAAYDYGIDPRYSPAIARVESGSGEYCFLPCNAWGWGNASWYDWDEAIYAHVKGLAQFYGPTLSYEDAQRYNPESTGEWYGEVCMFMDMIWPDGEL